MSGKIYGARNIERHCQVMKSLRDHREEAAGSIADKPHQNNREADRRRRQAERRAKKS